MTESFFTGPFAPMCELFVSQKRAAGLAYRQQSILLRMFDDFCKDYTVRDYEITEEIAVAWAARRPNEREVTRHNRIAEMQRFSLFLSGQGHKSYLFPALPKAPGNHQPYIFSEDEIRRLFTHLDGLEPTNSSPYRHLAYPCLMRILYGCGTRVTETLDLQKRDVDLEKGILYIRHGKNDAERIVPMSRSVTECCRNYASAVHASTDGEIPFFFTKEKDAYSRHTIGKAFRGFLWDVGIPYRGKDAGPRLHDVRHTFVCHCIKRWAEAGIPIYSRLPALSKYLGHSSVSATQWYLHLSADIYPHIRNVCEQAMGGMYEKSLAAFTKEDEDE